MTVYSDILSHSCSNASFLPCSPFSVPLPASHSGFVFFICLSVSTCAGSSCSCTSGSCAMAVSAFSGSCTCFRFSSSRLRLSWPSGSVCPVDFFPRFFFADGICVVPASAVCSVFPAVSGRDFGMIAENTSGYRSLIPVWSSTIFPSQSAPMSSGSKERIRSGMLTPNSLWRLHVTSMADIKYRCLVISCPGSFTSASCSLSNGGAAFWSSVFKDKKRSITAACVRSFFNWSSSSSSARAIVSGASFPYSFPYAIQIRSPVVPSRSSTSRMSSTRIVRTRRSFARSSMTPWILSSVSFINFL